MSVLAHSLERRLNEKGWAKVPPAGYAALSLEAHDILRDVPVHDVWEIRLPGGGAGREVTDLLDLMRLESVATSNVLARSLFGLRHKLGEFFGWDDDTASDEIASYDERVPDALRRASRVEAGRKDGPLELLYALEAEALQEVRNATVHAFSVIALEALPAEDGYRVLWAIHVKPVGKGTAFYMALIDPFRNWIVYPAILSHIRKQWLQKYASA